jgi:hypothetical protein
MKKSSAGFPLALVFSILAAGVTMNSCKKTENPIKFPKGEFPDTSLALAGINTIYNDYNSDIHMLNNGLNIVFSSDRVSTGEQYDLVQGSFSYTWDQEAGIFDFSSEVTNDAFLASLTGAANTSGDDFGPYRVFSAVDGYNYLILSSENASGNLDIYYLKHLPVLTPTLPIVKGPYPATLLNTGSNEGYISFDLNRDSAYFASDIGGDFDIYMNDIGVDTTITEWLSGAYESSVKVDSINTSSHENCPFVYKKVMIFASNRPGGMGGYDLYYSLFKNGKWNTPKNMGPSINTNANEFRPVIETDNGYSNYLLIFSSDRTGGKGGYDLYFRGVKFYFD